MDSLLTIFEVWRCYVVESFLLGFLGFVVGTASIVLLVELFRSYK